jgi:hypothetical protein
MAPIEWSCEIRQRDPKFNLTSQPYRPSLAICAKNSALRRTTTPVFADESGNQDVQNQDVQNQGVQN